MRPIQIWVADVRAPDFAAEAHRQAAAVAACEHAADDQAFIDAISVDDKPDAPKFGQLELATQAKPGRL